MTMQNNYKTALLVILNKPFMVKNVPNAAFI